MIPLPPRGSRFSNIVVFTGLLLLTTIYAAWVWSGELTELGGDSAGYLLMARYYSPYHAASAAVLAYKSQIITPPLFPWLLAIVDGGYNLFAAHLVVAFFAVGAISALYLWLRSELLPIGLSAIIALIFAAMPATLLQVFNIWSEFPFVFFSLASIALLARADASTSPRIWFWCAVMVACASLTRVASLPLLAAFILFLLYKRPRKFHLIALVSILPFAIWASYSSHSETGAGSYVNHLFSVYSSDPLEKFIQQLRREYGAVMMAWQSGWLGMSFSQILPKLITGFGLICISGWLYRLKSLRFDAIYVAFYLVLLFVWPHPEEALRYSFVLYPILITNGFLLLSVLSRCLPGLRSHALIPGVVGGILITSMLPTLTYNVVRFFDAAPEDLAFVKHRSEWYSDSRMLAIDSANFQFRFSHHLKEVARIVPPQDCIFAIKPTVVTFYSDRDSYIPPKITDDDKQFGADIKKCRFAYILPFASPSFGLPFYPLARLGDKAKVLTRIDDERGQMEGELIQIMP